MDVDEDVEVEAEVDVEVDSDVPVEADVFVVDELSFSAELDDAFAVAALVVDDAAFDEVAEEFVVDLDAVACESLTTSGSVLVPMPLPAVETLMTTAQIATMTSAEMTDTTMAFFCTSFLRRRAARSRAMLPEASLTCGVRYAFATGFT